MKTCELTGAALDWAVAKCEGASADILESYIDGMREANDGNYSTDWSQGGPIIEQERIFMQPIYGGPEKTWFCTSRPRFGMNFPDMTGPTPLIAAMRCYVASKLGEEVEIPEELK